MLTLLITLGLLITQLPELKVQDTQTPELTDDSVPLTPLWERTRGVPEIEWLGDRFIEAQREAEDRQVNILLWVLRDEDPASEGWASQRLLDRDFLRVLENETVPAIVWLPARSGQKHSSEQIRDSKESKPRWRCPRLKIVNCSEHTGSEKLLENITIPELLPAAFLLSPTGELIKQIKKEVPFQDYKALSKALKEQQSANRATRTNLNFFKIHIKRASDYFENGEFSLGSRELVAAKRTLSKFGPRVSEEWNQAARPYLGYGTRLLLRAKQIGRVDASRRIVLLRTIAEELAGLAPGQTAASLLKREQKLRGN
ncbi:MAG: hypothetical protein AAEJ04_01635 [Planctomycetota bacterium]